MGICFKIDSIWNRHLPGLLLQFQGGWCRFHEPTPHGGAIIVGPLLSTGADTMKAKPSHLILFALFWLLAGTAIDAGAGEYAFVTLEYPPLEYKGANGLAQGVAVELVTQIMTDLGHRVTVEVLPWTRAVKTVRYGKADAIFTIFRNSERETFLDFTREVLVPQRVAFYAPSDSPITFNDDIKALAKHRIGVVSTISYGRRFDKLRPELAMERTASLEQNFSKMIHGRIDLVISNVHSAENIIRKMKLGEKIQQLHPYVESVPSYVAFSKQKGLTALKQDFDRQLRQFKRNGRYAVIMGEAGLTFEASELED